jgi:soluble lytic murein transglycosylase-like protein
MTRQKPGNDTKDMTRTQLLRELARQAEARASGRASDESARPVSFQGTLAAWEAEQRDRLRRRMADIWNTVRSPARAALITSVAFLLGLQLAARPDGARLAGLENDLESTRGTLQARQGELALVRLELHRLEEILAYSNRYRLPADLAAAINDIALAEGIAPEIAFQLVRVESGFYRRAVSPMGAVGLAQLMPPTAFELDPSLRYVDLFDRDTNLRLGFRYLRQMIDKYDGDLRLALLAYNRGPGTVDGILSTGGDPSNGYARAVLRGADLAR